MITTESAVAQFTPKNKEQEDAIASGRAFIKSGDPSEWFMIVGKAGTGKTTIVQEIIRPFIARKEVLVCALSHQAKLVLANKIEDTFGANCVVAKSIAGALGMNMDLETGNFIVSYSDKAKKQPAIKTADIIIVDEGSMVNEESHRLIMAQKRKKTPVIYLGDVRQLPPIREQGSPYTDRPSPVFYTKNLSILTERVRQGEDSPILPFADYFGDNSRVKHPLKNPAPPSYRITTNNRHGNLAFADNIMDVIDENIELYRKSVREGLPSLIKTVAYRNDTRHKINDRIRFCIFGTPAKQKQFIAKDMLIFQDNFSIPGFEDPISNSFQMQINQAMPKTNNGYNVWELDFIYEKRPVSIMVLATSDVKKHADDVSALFREAKSLPYGQERIDALARAWGLRKRYAPVEHAYAITSHKCQGSTYHTVIVDEQDVMSVSMTSNKEKSQSMYTALTRASHCCIVVDGYKN